MRCSIYSSRIRPISARFPSGRKHRRKRGAGITSPALLQVFANPVVDKLDDLVAVPVEEHFMHIPVYAHVLEADEVILCAGLIEPLGNAHVEDAMIRALGG